MGEFLKVVKFQDAQEKIKKYLPVAQVENAHLFRSYGRVIASPVISCENLPAFNRTTVDGYALNADDTFGCSESIPAFMELVGEVKMGEEVDLRLTPGQCCWIPTGGMLPQGSNAAVMVEYTEKLDENTVLIYRPVGPWENIMQKGEDIYKEQEIFSPGKRIRPQDIGLLASLGLTRLDVYKPYDIGIISTGDEIIPIEDHPQIGQVRDVNTYALAAAVQACGSKPRIYPIVKDNVHKLKEAVDRGLQDNDVLLMSGGSSVGIKDVTLDVLLSYPDAELLFHGIAVKPGKPTLAVRIGKKLVIGLPGHPVSALTIFHIVCAPALSFTPSVATEATLSMNLPSQAGRDDFVPVKLVYENDRRMAVPLLGKSGLMSILSLADAYIHIDYEKQGIKQGDRVTAYIF
jgi:molybdopterin molybdotransferase